MHSAWLACSEEAATASVLIRQKEIDFSVVGHAQTFVLQEDAGRASVHLRWFDRERNSTKSSLGAWQRSLWVPQKGTLISDAHRSLSWEWGVFSRGDLCITYGKK